MNDYMPLIMGAAFVIALSIVTKLITGKGLHKKDKEPHIEQRELDFPRAETKMEEHPREITAGARGR